MKKMNHFFECPHCKTEFKEKKELDNHLKDKTCFTKCKICGEIFKTEEEFRNHSHYKALGTGVDFDIPISDSESNEMNENFFDQVAFNRLFEKTYIVSGYKDPIKCFARYRPKFRALLMKFLQKGTIKYFCTMKVRMYKIGGEGGRVYDSVGFFGGNFHCLTDDDIDEQLDQASHNLNLNFEKFATNGSGWILEKVEKITIKIAKNIDIRGGSYIPTPSTIKKSALINVQNFNDLRCFEYSILAAIHNGEVGSNPSRPSSYKQWLGIQFDFSDFPVPMHPSMIPKFERKNNLSINLYHIDSMGSQITPLLISKKREKNPINLLLIEDKDKEKYHYTWIKNLNGLFSHGKGRNSEGCRYCPYCLTKFSKNKKLTNINYHLENCGSYEAVKVIMPSDKEKYIKFKNYSSMDRHPVVIYADLESLNLPFQSHEVENAEKSYTKRILQHQASGYSFTVVSPYYGNKTITYHGPNAIPHFFQSIEREEKKIRNWFYKNEHKMDKLTIKEENDFRESQQCYLCKEEIFSNDWLEKNLADIVDDLNICNMNTKKFPSSSDISLKKKSVRRTMKIENNAVDKTKCENILESLGRIEQYRKQISLAHPGSLKGGKVADHNHFNGKFLGASHNVCNINRRKFYRIPCFFHNFSGYDSHLIVKMMKGMKYSPKVIAKSMEKYIYLKVNRIEFKDSLQFLPHSLDTLAKNLNDKTGKAYEKFPNLFKYFKEKWGGIDESNFQMLTSKLHYPYSYISNFGVFEETIPPSKKNFKNDLTDSEISDEDYNSFLELWRTFNLQNIGQLHDLYVETDVLLLADCFEKFRTFSLREYRLDPAHFLTAPSLSWHSALLYTNVVLEIPTDPDMHIFIDKGIRGGISFVGNPYAEASNKYVNPNSDPESDYIMFFDVNNQYGAAMSEYIPTGSFKWNSTFKDMTPAEVKEFVLNLSDTDPIGYIFDCDLEYSEKLHDLHDEFPFCPQNLSIKDGWLSSYQKEMKEKFNIKGSSKKLCLTLHDKENYIVHYRNLQFYLSHGLEIKKVNRVLQFEQSDWLRPYINLNSKLRREANSKFEESFPKLMNNSFFGKTCQNKRKYTNIKLVTSADEAKKLISSPRMFTWKLIDDDLGIFNLHKSSIKLDKPRYIGFCVLELSKLIMYKFHYDYILPKFPKTKVLFTDTDSFCYHIKTKEDVYDVIRGNSEWFDFSNYPQTHRNFDDKVNHLKPGVFKDEMAGVPIKEFIGLRSKMYSILVSNGGGKRTAKGFLRSMQTKLTHQDYHHSLFDTENLSYEGKKIMQKDHSLFIAKLRKKGLCPYNDKKFIAKTGDKFCTHSFGHYSLK